MPTIRRREFIGGALVTSVALLAPRSANAVDARVEVLIKALVEHMRRIKPGVLRWPGGCFADSYNWHDGVGPRSERPRRTNFWIRDTTQNSDSPQVYEPNQFGTNEFARFCKLIGAQPYFAANLRSLPAKDFYEWVEYCNAPADLTTLSRMRAVAGDREPFGVRYWGVGNESWGCGGNLTAEEYAWFGSERRRPALDTRVLHQAG